VVLKKLIIDYIILRAKYELYKFNTDLAMINILKQVVFHPVQTLKLILKRNLGFEIVVYSKSSNEYRKIFPIATYSPWLCDDQFQSTYNAIKDYTLVDIYRCFELWQLVLQCEKIPGAIIEVGVWRGGTAGIICSAIHACNSNKHAYLADTFTGVTKAGDYDKSYKGGEHSDCSVKNVNDFLSGKLGLNNYTILQGVFPEDTAGLIKESKFSLCHVDVDVYLSALDIEKWIWPKLSIGGMMIYDDYGFSGCNGIKNFVNQERQKGDRLIIHNLNGHAIVVKTSDSIQEY